MRSAILLRKFNGRLTACLTGIGALVSASRSRQAPLGTLAVGLCLLLIPVICLLALIAAVLPDHALIATALQDPGSTVMPLIGLSMASFSKETFTPDKLIAGHTPIISRKGTLLSGENRTRGAVLGKITLGAASSAAKAGGNTGNGTFVLDVTTPVRAGAKAGIYTLRVVDVPATHGSIWELKDPDGFVIANPVVAGSGGTVTVDNDIKGVITDGGTDFIVGDGFDITIAAGSGKYKLSVAAAVDGSQEPDAILAEDCDATSADKQCLNYYQVDVAESALTLGAGHTVASIREGLRKKGINIVTITGA